MSDQGEFQDPYFFKKSTLNLTGRFDLGGSTYSTSDILSAIGPILTGERKTRIDQVIEQRTFGVVPVMENIYDRGNISAVMRSAEAFGFLRCHIIEAHNAKFKASNRVTKGADKWLDTKVFPTAKESVSELKTQGYKVYATHLEASMSLGDVDFSQKTAVVLGNEKDGVSLEMVDLCDGNVIIPMAGFSQSFNISVAAALIFYHAYYERKQKGFLGDLSENEAQLVKANYFLRCIERPERILQRWKLNQ